MEHRNHHFADVIGPKPCPISIRVHSAECHFEGLSLIRGRMQCIRLRGAEQGFVENCPTAVNAEVRKSVLAKSLICETVFVFGHVQVLAAI